MTESSDFSIVTVTPFGMTLQEAEQILLSALYPISKDKPRMFRRYKLRQAAEQEIPLPTPGGKARAATALRDARGRFIKKEIHHVTR